jgi:GPH family glycoside/pentoside/hexuronide:cation symporter
MVHPSKLTFREKIGYGLGDSASSIFYKLFTTFLMFFYTDVFGIPAAAAGTMILITRIWDAANDPIMGLIADRTSTRWGKFRPYLIWVAVPFGIIGVLTFTTPNFGPAGKLVYAYVTYTLLMMVYTAINVPYSSLIGVMTSDSVQRTSLASYRYFFAFAGGILVQASLLKLAKFYGKGNDPLGWQLSVSNFAVIAIILFILTFLWTKERVKPIHKKKSSLKEDLKDLVTNPQWFIMVFVAIFTVIFNQLREGAAVYYFKYYIAETNISLIGKQIHLDYTTLTGILIPVWTGSNILGVLMATWLARTMGKKRAYALFMIISVFASLLYYTVKPDSIYYLLFLQIIVGIAAGLPIPLMLAMFGDIVDYSEWKTGRRATGLIFSSISMSQKFGSALGIALTGYILAAFGYQADQVTAETQTGIRFMMSVIPAIAAGLSVLLLYFYKLNDRFMKSIENELDIKRGEK